MLVEWFVLGSLAGNVILFLAFVLCCALVEEYASAVSGIIVASLAIFTIFGDARPFAWLYEHFYTTVTIVALYFVIGTGWAVGKWWFFVRNVRDAVLEMRAKFLEANGLPLDTTSMPRALFDLYNNAIQRAAQTVSGRDDVPPKAVKNKARIISWMTYWPASVLYTLLSDVVGMICKEIYRAIGGILQRIADVMWQKVPEVTRSDEPDPTRVFRP